MVKEELLEEIYQQLATIKNLLVAGLIESKDQKRQIRILSFAGFQPKEIARILRTTPNAVRVMLSKLRKVK